MQRSYVVIIDGVIFRLQGGRPKGISVVWKSLIPELARQFPAPSKLYFLDQTPASSYTNELARAEGVVYIDRSQLSLKDAIEQKVLYQFEQVAENEKPPASAPIVVFISTYYEYTDLPGLCNILMYHDLIPENVGYGHGPGSEYYPRIELLDTVGSVVSVSESTTRDIVKWYGDKVFKRVGDPFYSANSADPRNLIVSTTPNRISRDVFPGIASRQQILKFRKKYKLPTGEDPPFTANDVPLDYMMTVGAAYSYKNTKHIFAAMDLLPDVWLRRFSMLLVGRDGPSAEELEQIKRHPVRIIEADGSERTVDASSKTASSVPVLFRVISYIDLADLPVAYSGSIGLVYISAYEGFGLPLVEALTSGTLAVAHNCSSLPEVGGPDGPVYVQDATQPQLVKDAMLELLTMSADERTRRIMQTRKHVERYGGGGAGGIGHGWDEMAALIARHIRSQKHRTQQCYTPYYKSILSD